MNASRPRWCVRVAALGALAALGACGEVSPVVGRWTDAGDHRWRALDVRDAAQAAAGARAGFTALPASRTGVTHRNDVDDAHALANRDLLIGAGAAVGDVDGDGLPDLFLASVERPAALYRNVGGLRFEDVTAASGLRTDSLATTGGVLADVDGDGDVDLDDWAGFALCWTGPLGGVAPECVLSDMDFDGDVDLADAQLFQTAFTSGG